MPEERRAVVGEADEALVEGRVPEGREEKAVVDVASSDQALTCTNPGQWGSLVPTMRRRTPRGRLPCRPHPAATVKRVDVPIRICRGRGGTRTADPSSSHTASLRGPPVAVVRPARTGSTPLERMGGHGEGQSEASGGQVSPNPQKGGKPAISP